MKGLARNLGLFAGPAERGYAKEASEQLLDVFWRERREHPDLISYVTARNYTERMPSSRCGDRNFSPS